MLIRTEANTMRRTTSLISSALALLSMFGSQPIAWAQEQGGPAKPQYYWICTASIQGPNGSYISTAFAAREGTSLDDARSGAPVGRAMTEAWTSHVLHTYSPEQEKEWWAHGRPSLGRCVLGALLDVQAMRDRYLKASAVEVTWQYTGQTAVAPPASPQAETPQRPPTAAAAVPPANPAKPFGSGPTYYTLCYSQTPDTMYFSGIFVTPDGAPWFDAQPHDPADHGFAFKPLPWVTQFTEFLAHRNSRNKNGAYCDNFTTSAEAQAKLDNLSQYAHNYKINVAETGWKYAYTPVPTPAPTVAPPATANQPVAATAVPPKPAAPPPAVPVAPKPAPPPAVRPAPETPYAVCWGASQKPLTPTAYFSLPFDASVQNSGVWNQMYRIHLNHKYGPGSAGPLRCNTLKSLALAQQFLQQTVDDLRPTHKIIQTGWKYQ